MGGRDGDRERRSPYLPSGYYFDDTSERDFSVWWRGNCSEVSAFGERADPREKERVVWEGHSQRGG